MSFKPYFIVVLCICTDFVIASYDPNIDRTFFKIAWPGSLDSGELAELTDENSMVVMSKDNEKFRCVLPSTIVSTTEEDVLNYAGPNEFEILEPLMDQTSCSYRIEAYWTYELCHGRHLRQYHEEKEMGKKSRLQEYYLGVFDRVVGKAESKMVVTVESTYDEIPTEKPKAGMKRIEGVEVPYYEQTYGGGTVCDVTNQPRLARLHYTCHLEGRGEVYEIKETASCEYEVVVLTSLLCAHPAYAPPKESTNTIQCHSLDNAGFHMPKSLVALEAETMNRYNKYQDQMYERIHKKQSSTFYQKPAGPTPAATASAAGAKQPLTSSSPTPAPTPAPTPNPNPTTHNPKDTGSTAIGKLTDQQLIRDFLAGTFCIKGGTGWWKHEFCYGRRVTQYHEDKSGDGVVALGTWNEEAHKTWLQKNPNKQPKDEKRKSVSQFYGNGDICDLTGKPRFTEVKLKCKDNPTQPHAVAIYLVEPNSCEYIVVVESPLLCSLIEQADQNGLFPNPDL